MKHDRLIAALVACACHASAGFAQTASALTKDELQRMLPGTTVVSTGIGGASHHWTNDAGGTFTATSDEMGRGRSSTAQGGWHVSDDGKYCVHVDWKRYTEDWCAPVVQTADGKYTLVQGGSAGAPTQIEISR
ncbi:DUF995 domain-containing protein [Paraburkholderia caballeronis]|uniref:Avidin family protein n=1 Tax=Paraburkholderia caballeronis TaxID=416943 RepID=A0A1H7SG59_9BURK|nr:DUF995 domain-containing protein [Paraburkholderia caballeronis]PXW22288.1 uncharacterized protein DUF995 [Paraburkholderia caballeronis]PXW95947.1 uncharacterized protein DUF995 [Paraburkholderia caballeronis]RAJ92313.1 uncharacterized protein DUF995 [Paraburkholderia caballeronis]SEB52960.1 Protein of unknown function [Paraburkholderia caballeronis]SEL71495.1 Protein of unknown function [Paraburkholderia caballeronis]